MSQTGQWRRGPIAQYFQVIEASANSRLLAILDRIVRSNEAIENGEPDKAEWKRHIEIRCLAAEVPLHYLFDFTRAGMREAVERGVAEGRRWCRSIPEIAAPSPDETGPSRVYGPDCRLRFRERMSGAVQFGTDDCVLGADLGSQLGQRLSVQLTVDIDNVAWFAAEPRHRATVAGTVLWDQLAGGKADICDGHVSLFVYRHDPRRKQMVYVLPFTGPHDKKFTLVGIKFVTNDPGGARRRGPLRIWTDTTTLYTRIVNGAVMLDPVSGEPDGDANPVVCAGILRLTTPAFLHELLTFRPGGGIGGGLESLAGFGQFFVRQLWQVYGHPATHPENRPTPIDRVLRRRDREQPSAPYPDRARMSRPRSRREDRQSSEFQDWPTGNAPSDAWVYARNELAVPVPPEQGLGMAVPGPPVATLVPELLGRTDPDQNGRRPPPQTAGEPGGVRTGSRSDCRSVQPSIHTSGRITSAGRGTVAAGLVWPAGTTSGLSRPSRTAAGSSPKKPRSACCPGYSGWVCSRPFTFRTSYGCGGYPKTRSEGFRGETPESSGDLTDELGPRAHGKLPVDITKVVLDGLDAEEEGRGHLLVGQSLRHR